MQGKEHIIWHQKLAIANQICHIISTLLSTILLAAFKH